MKGLGSSWFSTVNENEGIQHSSIMRSLEGTTKKRTAAADDLLYHLNAFTQSLVMYSQHHLDQLLGSDMTWGQSHQCCSYILR